MSETTTRPTIWITDSATGESIQIAVATATPVEVDTVLYRLYNEAFDLRQQGQQVLERMHHQAGDKHNYYAKTWGLTTDEVLDRVNRLSHDDPTYVGRNAGEALAAYNQVLADLATNQATQAPLHAEFDSRPWTRAFLVTDGHVHRSMECSTCFPTTRFTWLTDLSGKDEAEIVALAGERACTVCYPSAPTLRDFEKASPLFTEEEAQRNADRAARAEAKVARDAKKIAKALTADGSEFVVVTAEYPTPEHLRRPGRDEITTSREHFKTEQAAIQWAVQQIAWGHEGTASQHYNRVPEAIAAIVSAYATKHGITEPEARAVVDAKVEAKVKRDGYDGRTAR